MPQYSFSLIPNASRAVLTMGVYQPSQSVAPSSKIVRKAFL